MLLYHYCLCCKDHPACKCRAMLCVSGHEFAWTLSLVNWCSNEYTILVIIAYLADWVIPCIRDTAARQAVNYLWVTLHTDTNNNFTGEKNLLLQSWASCIHKIFILYSNTGSLSALVHCLKKYSTEVCVQTKVADSDKDK